MKDYALVLEEVKAWCQEVGTLQIRRFRDPHLHIQTKTNIHDLVTEVDQKSEQLLISRIKQHYPGTAILAEESGSHPGEAEYLWVIDPLDGTNNYAQGLPIFAISIALQVRGQTQLGVVYAPYLQEMFYAQRGHGAYLNGLKLQVAQKKVLQECVLGTGFPYDKAQHPINNLAYFAHVLPQIRGMRRMGAAAYDLCAVAAGWLDGYWELNLGLWDVAAGSLVVEEAGGMIIPLRNDRKVSIVAANPQLARQICQELHKVEL